MNQPPPILGRKFSGLVSKINSGECVLVLGPKIAMPDEIGYGSIPIDKYLADRLLEDLNRHDFSDLRGAISRYEKEKSTSACRSLLQQLVCELDEHTTNLHRDLASLPFRLVLSATYDRMMANAFRSCGKPAVIDCPVDYSENLRLSERLKALETT